MVVVGWKGIRVWDRGGEGKGKEGKGGWESTREAGKRDELGSQLPLSPLGCGSKTER